MAIAANLDWSCIPSLALENVFSYLTWRERYQASMVCSSWYDVFYSPSLWRTVVLEPKVRGTRKIHYDMAAYHVEQCFHHVGRYIRHIVVPATENFFLLNRFLCIIATYLDTTIFRRADSTVVLLTDYDLASADDILPPEGLDHIETFRLVFHSEVGQDHVYGTGGHLLRSIKLVLSRLSFLRCLELNNLLLCTEDAQFLLEDFQTVSCASLTELTLINASLQPTPLFEVAMFPNLRVLNLSPINIDTDLLQMLVKSTALEKLILTQNELSVFPSDWTSPIDEDGWRCITQLSPSLRLYLRLVGSPTRDLILPPWTAPVASVVHAVVLPLASQFLDPSRTHHLVAYGPWLTTLVLTSPCLSTDRRIDNCLHTLVVDSPSLKTVVIRGDICTFTLLWLAYTLINGRGTLSTAKSSQQFDWNKKLDDTFDERSEMRPSLQSCRLVVLRQGWVNTDEVIWSRESLGWSEELFYSISMLAGRCCRSPVDLLEAKIGAILGQPKWCFVEDKEFNKIVESY